MSSVMSCGPPRALEKVQAAHGDLDGRVRAGGGCGARPSSRGGPKTAWVLSDIRNRERESGIEIVKDSFFSSRFTFDSRLFKISSSVKIGRRRDDEDDVIRTSVAAHASDCPSSRARWRIVQSDGQRSDGCRRADEKAGSERRTKAARSRRNARDRHIAPVAMPEAAAGRPPRSSPPGARPAQSRPRARRRDEPNHLFGRALGMAS